MLAADGADSAGHRAQLDRILDSSAQLPGAAAATKDTDAVASTQARRAKEDQGTTRILHPTHSSTLSAGTTETAATRAREAITDVQKQPPQPLRAQRHGSGPSLPERRQFAKSTVRAAAAVMPPI